MMLNKTWYFLHQCQEISVLQNQKVALLIKDRYIHFRSIYNTLVHKIKESNKLTWRATTFSMINTLFHKINVDTIFIITN